MAAKKEKVTGKDMYKEEQVTKTTADTSEETTTEVVIATVKGGRLNVRKDPSKDHAPVTVLDDGAEVEVLEIGEEWCKVKDGYVMRQFLAF